MFRLIQGPSREALGRLFEEVLERGYPKKLFEEAIQRGFGESLWGVPLGQAGSGWLRLVGGKAY